MPLNAEKRFCIHGIKIMHIDQDHQIRFHRFLFVLLIMIFITGLPGEAAGVDRQRPIRGNIVIGGDADYPPFEYLDDAGQPAGFIVDISCAIAREVGLDITFRLDSWVKVLDDLETGRVNVLQGMFYSSDRDMKYDFTQAHSVNNYVVVVRKGERKIPSGLSELKDLHIVVQKSDIMHEFAIKNKLGHPLSVVDNPQCALSKLAGGRYDCALMARVPTLYLIHKNGWDDFDLGKKPILTTQYCYAVPDNHKALLAQFSEGLNIIEENGEYRRIYEKWLGIYQAPYPDFSTILGYVVMVAVPLILLALLFFLWSWSLRKQVANRTLALGRREKQYRLLADNTLDVIWTTNLDFEFTYVNPAVTALTGYSPGEWIGSRLSDHCDQDNFIRITRVISHAMSRGKRDTGTIFDVGILKKDGGVIWVEIHGRIIYDEADTPVGLQGVARDVSERKASEEKHHLLETQLAQARKMESVGRLAGGVAHDYNNMLSIIIGYAEMGQRTVSSNDLLYDYFEAILTAARRSTDITRQLLAFARKQTIVPKVLDLNDTLESMLKMVRRLIGEDIDLAWRPGTGVWPVKMDPSQVDQILVNLCVNARDAIAGVGKITIETKNVSFDGAYCRDHAGFIPGEYILLAVSDDGTGMSPDTVENIFEPFFTTKDPGKGTGLGLATVYGIVKQNQGFINVYSELEKGSTIRIYLPRHLDGVSGKMPAPAVEMPLSQGEKVLLVEDDGAILDLCKQMLENMGYTVWTADSPGAALAMAGDIAHQIELLITDVVMPYMNGRDLAGEFLAINADLKILFMSGYTANVIGHRGVLDKGVNFIAKPFSQKELAIKVREILDN